MHDIGRTQLEFPGHGGLTAGAGEYGEFAEYGEAMSPGEDGETTSPLAEMQEVELASELLEVASEDQLEQFLGKLIGTVGRSVGRFVRSDTGRALGGILRSAARQALPMAGHAVGSWVAPGGGAAGARLATRAGRLLGLELEGLSAEEQEFEVARQFVRFAGAAAARASFAPAGDPRTTAAAAASSAARTYAPGLMTRLQGRSGRLWPRQGRWLRRGRAIVLYGG